MLAYKQKHKNWSLISLAIQPWICQFVCSAIHQTVFPIHQLFISPTKIFIFY